MYTPAIGNFGIVKTNGFAGFLIRLGTFSRWNHAFIYLGDGNIIEARPTGVRISNISEYKNIAWNKHEDLTEEQRQQIVQTALLHKKDKYAFIDILVIAIRILGLKMRIPLVYSLAKREGVICSELVALSYASARVSLSPLPEFLVTPGDLSEYLIYQ